MRNSEYKIRTWFSLYKNKKTGVYQMQIAQQRDDKLSEIIHKGGGFDLSGNCYGIGAKARSFNSVISVDRYQSNYV